MACLTDYTSFVILGWYFSALYFWYPFLVLVLILSVCMYVSVCVCMCLYVIVPPQEGLVEFWGKLISRHEFRVKCVSVCVCVVCKNSNWNI